MVRCRIIVDRDRHRREGAVFPKTNMRQARTLGPHPIGRREPRRRTGWQTPEPVLFVGEPCDRISEKKKYADN
jgi:hypothetical protein